MSWEEHFKRLEALDTEDPARMGMARQFLEALGRELLQGHQIVEKQADAEVEMRGALNGLPARATFDLNFAMVQWEMRASNPSGLKFFLRFDEDAIPKAGAFTGAAAGAWGDEKEKVFFGRGYYVEESAALLPKVLAVYEAFPAEVRQALAKHMPADRVALLRISEDGGLLCSWRDRLPELGPDVYYRTARGLWLLGQVAFALSKVDPSSLPRTAPGAAGATGAGGAGAIMTCTFCQTRFLLQQNPACPNCGAHPR